MNEGFYDMVRSRCDVAGGLRSMKRLEILVERDIYRESMEFSRKELENDGLEVVLTRLSPS